VRTGRTVLACRWLRQSGRAGTGTRSRGGRRTGRNSICVLRGIRLRDDCKQAFTDKAIAGTARVFTDPLSSPTGFPFKAARLEDSASEQDVYDRRTRICDVGYLREAYRTNDGRIGYRCSAEPVNAYVSKGGPVEKTFGKKCLCNALLANIGHAQIRNGTEVEPCLMTGGDDLNEITRFLPAGEKSYSAAEVIAILMRGCSDATC